jgi:hypothetical protein
MRERETERERHVLMLVEFNFCCAIQVEFLKWRLHDLQAEFLEEFLELATLFHFTVLRMWRRKPISAVH